MGMLVYAAVLSTSTAQLLIIKQQWKSDRKTGKSSQKKEEKTLIYSKNKLLRWRIEMMHP